MANEIKVKPVWDQVLIASAYLYLVLPILIFLFGGLKLPLAVMAGAVLLVGTHAALRDFGYVKDRGGFHLEFIAFSLLIAFAWVVLSGIGGFGFQNEDFLFKNAVLRDLINHPWPVVYDYSRDPVLRVIFGRSGALVYYFAYWLPSALVGKLFGWQMANLALFIWTLLGIFLCVLLMARYIGRSSLPVVLAFVGWSGLDYLGLLIVRFHAFAADAYRGGVFSARKFLGTFFAKALMPQDIAYFPGLWVSYPGFTSQLYWSYNQVVPAWVVTLLILNIQNKRPLLFTYVLVLLFAPLPAIGLLPYLIYKLLEHVPLPIRGRQELFRSAKQWARENAIFQTSVAVIVLGMTAVAYFGAQAENQPRGLVWNLLPVTRTILFDLVVFYVLKVLVFGLFAFNKGENRTLILISLVWLALIPAFMYGTSDDFGLRACVPPLLILFTVGFKNFCSRMANDAGTLKMQLTRIALVVILVIGSIPSLHEILRSRDAIVRSGGFPAFADAVLTLGDSGAENANGYVPEDPRLRDFVAYKMRYIRNFVVGDPESTWFFWVVARR